MAGNTGNLDLNVVLDTSQAQTALTDLQTTIPKSLEKMLKKFESVGKKMEKLAKNAEGSSSAINKNVRIFAKATDDVFKKLAKSISQTDEVIKKFKKSVANDKTFQLLSKDMKDAQVGLLKYKQETERLQASSNSYLKTLAKRVELEKSLNDKKRSGESTKQLQKDIAINKNQLDQYENTLKNKASTINKLRTEIFDLSGIQLKSVNNKQIADSINRTFASMEDALKKGDSDKIKKLFGKFYKDQFKEADQILDSAIDTHTGKVERKIKGLEATRLKLSKKLAEINRANDLVGSRGGVKQNIGGLSEKDLLDEKGALKRLSDQEKLIKREQKILDDAFAADKRRSDKAYKRKEDEKERDKQEKEIAKRRFRDAEKSIKQSENWNYSKVGLDIKQRKDLDKIRRDHVKQQQINIKADTEKITKTQKDALRKQRRQLARFTKDLPTIPLIPKTSNIDSNTKKKHLQELDNYQNALSAKYKEMKNKSDAAFASIESRGKYNQGKIGGLNDKQIKKIEKARFDKETSIREKLIKEYNAQMAKKGIDPNKIGMDDAEQKRYFKEMTDKAIRSRDYIEKIHGNNTDGIRDLVSKKAEADALENKRRIDRQHGLTSQSYRKAEEELRNYNEKLLLLNKDFSTQQRWDLRKQRKALAQNDTATLLQYQKNRNSVGAEYEKMLEQQEKYLSDKVKARKFWANKAYREETKIQKEQLDHIRREREKIRRLEESDDRQRKITGQRGTSGSDLALGGSGGSRGRGGSFNSGEPPQQSGFLRTMRKEPIIEYRQAWEKLGGTFDSVSRISGMLRVALFTLGAGLGLKSIRDYFDAWTSFSNRIRLVTDSVSELKAVQEDLIGVADRTAISLYQSGELFEKFSRAGDKFGIQAAAKSQLAELVAQTISISGSTAQGAKGAVTQFIQGLGTELRGQELMSVREQIPRLATAIAEGLDVPISKLKQLGEQGKITPNVIMKALLSMVPTIKEEFQDVNFTIAMSFERISNALSVLLGRLFENLNKDGGLSGYIKDVSDKLLELANGTYFPDLLDKLEKLLKLFKAIAVVWFSMWSLKTIGAVFSSIIMWGKSLGVQFKALRREVTLLDKAKAFAAGSHMDSQGTLYTADQVRRAEKDRAEDGKKTDATMTRRTGGFIGGGTIGLIVMGIAGLIAIFDALGDRSENLSKVFKWVGEQLSNLLDVLASGVNTLLGWVMSLPIFGDENDKKRAIELATAEKVREANQKVANAKLRAEVFQEAIGGSASNKKGISAAMEYHNTQVAANPTQFTEYEKAQLAEQESIRTRKKGDIDLQRAKLNEVESQFNRDVSLIEEAAASTIQLILRDKKNPLYTEDMNPDIRKEMLAAGIPERIAELKDDGSANYSIVRTTDQIQKSTATASIFKEMGNQYQEDLKNLVDTENVLAKIDRKVERIEELKTKAINEQDNEGIRVQTAALENQQEARAKIVKEIGELELQRDISYKRLQTIADKAIADDSLDESIRNNVKKIMYGAEDQQSLINQISDQVDSIQALEKQMDAINAKTTQISSRKAEATSDEANESIRKATKERIANANKIATENTISLLREITVQSSRNRAALMKSDSAIMLTEFQSIEKAYADFDFEKSKAERNALEYTNTKGITVRRDPDTLKENETFHARVKEIEEARDLAIQAANNTRKDAIVLLEKQVASEKKLMAVQSKGLMLTQSGLGTFASLDLVGKPQQIADKISAERKNQNQLAMEFSNYLLESNAFTKKNAEEFINSMANWTGDEASAEMLAMINDFASDNKEIALELEGIMDKAIGRKIQFDQEFIDGLNETTSDIKRQNIELGIELELYRLNMAKFGENMATMRSEGGSGALAGITNSFMVGSSQLNLTANRLKGQRDRLIKEGGNTSAVDASIEGLDTGNQDLLTKALISLEIELAVAKKTGSLISQNNIKKETRINKVLFDINVQSLKNEREKAQLEAKRGKGIALNANEMQRIIDIEKEMSDQGFIQRRIAGTAEVTLELEKRVAANKISEEQLLVQATARGAKESELLEIQKMSSGLRESMTRSAGEELRVLDRMISKEQELADTRRKSSRDAALELSGLFDMSSLETESQKDYAAQLLKGTQYGSFLDAANENIAFKNQEYQRNFNADSSILDAAGDNIQEGYLTEMQRNARETFQREKRIANNLADNNIELANILQDGVDKSGSASTLLENSVLRSKSLLERFIEAEQGKLIEAQRLNQDAEVERRRISQGIISTTSEAYTKIVRDVANENAETVLEARRAADQFIVDTLRNEYKGFSDQEFDVFAMDAEQLQSYMPYLSAPGMQDYLSIEKQINTKKGGNIETNLSSLFGAENEALQAARDAATEGNLAEAESQQRLAEGFRMLIERLQVSAEKYGIFNERQRESLKGNLQIERAQAFDGLEVAERELAVQLEIAELKRENDLSQSQIAEVALRKRQENIRLEIASQQELLDQRHQLAMTELGYEHNEGSQDYKQKAQLAEARLHQEKELLGIQGQQRIVALDTADKLKKINEEQEAILKRAKGALASLLQIYFEFIGSIFSSIWSLIFGSEDERKKTQTDLAQGRIDRLGKQEKDLGEEVRARLATDTNTHLEKLDTTNRELIDEVRLLTTELKLVTAKDAQVSRRAGIQSFHKNKNINNYIRAPYGEEAVIEFDPRLFPLSDDLIYGSGSPQGLALSDDVKSEARLKRQTFHSIPNRPSPPPKFISKTAIDGGRRSMANFAGIGLSQNANSGSRLEFLLNNIGSPQQPNQAFARLSDGFSVATEKAKTPTVSAVNQLEETTKAEFAELRRIWLEEGIYVPGVPEAISIITGKTVPASVALKKPDNPYANGSLAKGVAGATQPLNVNKLTGGSSSGFLSSIGAFYETGAMSSMALPPASEEILAMAFASNYLAKVESGKSTTSGSTSGSGSETILRALELAKEFTIGASPLTTPLPSKYSGTSKSDVASRGMGVEVQPMTSAHLHGSILDAVYQAYSKALFGDNESENVFMPTFGFNEAIASSTGHTGHLEALKNNRIKKAGVDPYRGIEGKSGAGIFPSIPDAEIDGIIESWMNRLLAPRLEQHGPDDQGFVELFPIIRDSIKEAIQDTGQFYPKIAKGQEDYDRFLKSYKGEKQLPSDIIPHAEKVSEQMIDVYHLQMALDKELTRVLSDYVGPILADPHSTKDDLEFAETMMSSRIADLIKLEDKSIDLSNMVTEFFSDLRTFHMEIKAENSKGPVVYELAKERHGKGGCLPKQRRLMGGGYLIGPSHDQGGIDLGVINGVRHEAEGGEYIVRRESVDRIGARTLDYMNQTGVIPANKKFKIGGMTQSASAIPWHEMGPIESPASEVFWKSISSAGNEISYAIKEFGEWVKTLIEKEEETEEPKFPWEKDGYSRDHSSKSGTGWDWLDNKVKKFSSPMASLREMDPEKRGKTLSALGKTGSSFGRGGQLITSLGAGAAEAAISGNPAMMAQGIADFVMSNKKVQKVMEKFGAILTKILDPLAEVFVPVFEAVGELFVELAEILTSLMPVIELFAQVLSRVAKIAGAVTGAVGGIVDSVSNAFSGVVNAISGIFGGGGSKSKDQRIQESIYSSMRNLESEYYKDKKSKSTVETISDSFDSLYSEIDRLNSSSRKRDTKAELDRIKGELILNETMTVLNSTMVDVNNTFKQIGEQFNMRATQSNAFFEGLGQGGEMISFSSIVNANSGNLSGGTGGNQMDGFVSAIMDSSRTDNGIQEIRAALSSGLTSGSGFYQKIIDQGGGEQDVLSLAANLPLIMEQTYDLPYSLGESRHHDDSGWYTPIRFDERKLAQNVGIRTQELAGGYAQKTVQDSIIAAGGQHYQTKYDVYGTEYAGGLNPEKVAVEMAEGVATKLIDIGLGAQQDLRGLISENLIAKDDGTFDFEYIKKSLSVSTQLFVNAIDGAAEGAGKLSLALNDTSGKFDSEFDYNKVAKRIELSADTMLSEAFKSISSGLTENLWKQNPLGNIGIKMDEISRNYLDKLAGKMNDGTGQRDGGLLATRTELETNGIANKSALEAVNREIIRANQAAFGETLALLENRERDFESRINSMESALGASGKQSQQQYEKEQFERELYEAGFGAVDNVEAEIKNYTKSLVDAGIAQDEAARMGVAYGEMLESQSEYYDKLMGLFERQQSIDLEKTNRDLANSIIDLNQSSYDQIASFQGLNKILGVDLPESLQAIEGLTKKDLIKQGVERQIKDLINQSGATVADGMAGLIKYGDDFEALAKELEIDPEQAKNLVETFEEYNKQLLAQNAALEYSTLLEAKRLNINTFGDSALTDLINLEQRLQEIRLSGADNMETLIAAEKAALDFRRGEELDEINKRGFGATSGYQSMMEQYDKDSERVQNSIKFLKEKADLDKEELATLEHLESKQSSLNAARHREANIIFNDLLDGLREVGIEYSDLGGVNNSFIERLQNIANEFGTSFSWTSLAENATLGISDILGDITHLTKQEQEWVKTLTSEAINGRKRELALVQKTQREADINNLSGFFGAQEEDYTFVTFKENLEALEEVIKSLDKTVEDLYYSDMNVSPFSEKLENAADKYERLLATALTPDENGSFNSSAINEFQGFINEFLGYNKDMYKSSSEYVKIYNQVMKDIQSVADTAGVYGTVTETERLIKALGELSTSIEVDDGAAATITTLIGTLEKGLPDGLTSAYALMTNASSMVSVDVEQVTSQMVTTMRNASQSMSTQFSALLGKNGTIQTHISNWTKDFSNQNDPSTLVGGFKKFIDDIKIWVSQLEAPSYTQTGNNAAGAGAATSQSYQGGSSSGSGTGGSSALSGDAVSGSLNKNSQIEDINYYMGMNNPGHGSLYRFLTDKDSAEKFGEMTLKNQKTSLSLSSMNEASKYADNDYAVSWIDHGWGVLQFFPDQTTKDSFVELFKDDMSVASLKYAQGGYLSGPSHAQGGIMAELEGGEYVMRKNAVSKMGVPFMEYLNDGGDIFEGGMGESGTSDEREDVKILLEELIHAVRESDQNNTEALDDLELLADVSVYTDLEGQTKAGIMAYESKLKELNRRGVNPHR